MKQNEYVVLNADDCDSLLEIVLCCQEQLEKFFQPRDDYKEFIELSIIIIGGIPPRVIQFRFPVALHRARWMATAIYAMKIWMFKSQFHLSIQDKRV